MSEPMMVFDAFFNYPDESKMDIGGWLVRGHDANDQYREVVVQGEWTNATFDMTVRGWHDWCRWPLEKGSPLLTSG